MAEEFEAKFIKPIVNASFPATLAGLDLAVLQFSTSPGLILSLAFLFGASGFLISALAIFSYTLYPTRRKVWTTTALAFLLGLLCSVFATLLLLVEQSGFRPP